MLDEEELKPQADSVSRPVVGSLGFFSDEFVQAALQGYRDFKAHRPDVFSMTQSQVDPTSLPPSVFLSLPPSCGFSLFYCPPPAGEDIRVVLRNRLQMVWGPPGTGKSQFLALRSVPARGAASPTD